MTKISVGLLIEINACQLSNGKQIGFDLNLCSDVIAFFFQQNQSRWDLLIPKWPFSWIA